MERLTLIGARMKCRYQIIRSLLPSVLQKFVTRLKKNGVSTKLFRLYNSAETSL